jgi:formylglycine-generating enzyme required for sulfatase activity
MKRFLFLLNFIGITFLSYSNNINVSNISITGQNTVSDFTLVQFNISWDNSWRTSTLESNWDAAWVFVKWRLKNQTVWNHATLNTTGHTAPAGSTITAPADGKGIFIYRSANGIGTNTWTAAQLRWNYGVDGLLDGDLVEVCVYAIEMVYIPQGAFYAGDGSVTNIRGQFEAGTSGTPFLVSSEAAITLGGGGGSLGNNNATGMATPDDFNETTVQTLPAAFPKGVNAFYIMKYEITQEQYVEFLNKLTYTQQATRTAVVPNSAAGTNVFPNFFIQRNGIDIQTPGVNTITPAIYACNYNQNTTYNETGDGQNIACNFLFWADMAAYLDWSGLRPFTELEFEKACRGGNLSPVPDEYAWGNINITAVTSITNDGFANEVATTSSANANYGNNYGSIRVGIFAQAATNRQSAGAAYYGAMELSCNIMDKVVTVGKATGRAFTGINGDGILDATGNANTINWPGINTIGIGIRGGSLFLIAYTLRVSDRSFAASDIDITLRRDDGGGRGGRIAP